jgi:hypothetical protein
MVSQILGREISFGIQEDGTVLECGIAGDSKTPVGGNLCRTGIGKVPAHDGKQVLNLLAAGLVNPAPGSLRSGRKPTFWV